MVLYTFAVEDLVLISSAHPDCVTITYGKVVSLQTLKRSSPLAGKSAVKSRSLLPGYGVILLPTFGTEENDSEESIEIDELPESMLIRPKTLDLTRSAFQSAIISSIQSKILSYYGRFVAAFNEDERLVAYAQVIGMTQIEQGTSLLLKCRHHGDPKKRLARTSLVIPPGGDIDAFGISEAQFILGPGLACDDNTILDDALVRHFDEVISNSNEHPTQLESLKPLCIISRHDTYLDLMLTPRHANPKMVL